QSLGMEIIQATVLVSDVRGYTALSENLPAHTVAEMLQRWFAVCTEIVETNGGEIDKYIGDSVMAFWRGRETAEDAVRAALEIQRTTSVLSSEWKHGTAHPWRCKTSLNTGEVLCGTVGIGDARKLTVLGDAVNVAFRLNDVASEAGEEITLGKDTAEAVKEK